jgi:hypothetical protein
METASTPTYTAFEGETLLCKGALTDVILKIKKRMGKADNSPALIFNDATGNLMDFNFQGSEKDVLRRLEVFVGEAEGKGKAAAADSAGPGRPKLGVMSREVSLLPRQWEWLASQSGGASAVLRRLVDEARRKSGEALSVKQTQERTYKFLSAMAGNLQGYEEAIRALYRKDAKGFAAHMEGWPRDVKRHAEALAGVRS